MSILWFVAGAIAGLFIPSPIDGVIRGWVGALWHKVFPG